MAGEDLVLYDSDGAKLHILNCTAAVVWKLCVGIRTPVEIGESLASSFVHGEDADVRSDTRKILMSFSEAELLHWSSPSSGADVGPQTAGCAR